MGVLSVILLVLFVAVCLLLIFIVAIQDENSEGLGGLFGGSSNTAFGSRIGSVVNKATAILGIAFMHRTHLARTGKDQPYQRMGNCLQEQGSRP